MPFTSDWLKLIVILVQSKGSRNAMDLHLVDTCETTIANGIELPIQPSSKASIACPASNMRVRTTSDSFETGELMVWHEGEFIVKLLV